MVLTVFAFIARGICLSQSDCLTTLKSDHVHPLWIQ
jgi:hypothetical protein